MSRASSVLAAALAATVAGCEAPRSGAYGFPDRAPPRPTDRAPEVEALAGAQRPLVVGQLDDLTIQPVGASYTEPGFVDRVAPGAGIHQTYFYWATAPTLRHAVRDGLVEHGVRALCDDADLGVKVPYGGPALPRGVLLLRGELVDFVYARVQGEDIVTAEVEWLLVDGDTGRTLARVRHRAAVAAQAAAGDDDDPIAALGERLAAQLLGDAVVRAALTSRPWTGAVEAGSPRREESPR